MRKGTSRKPVPFAALNFLDAFCDHLSHDFERLPIDYFGLTKLCSGLLQALLDAKRIPPAACGPPSKNGRRKPERESQTDGFVPFLPVIHKILQEEMNWEEMKSQVRKQAKACMAERTGPAIIRWDDTLPDLKQRPKVFFNGQEGYLDISHDSHISTASEFFQEYLDGKGVLSRGPTASDTAAQDPKIMRKPSRLSLTGETASAGEKSTYRKASVEDESSDEDMVTVSGRDDSELAAGEILFDPRVQ